MKSYVDYEFYVSEYGGKEICEDNFTVASLQATQYLKSITMGRSDSYTGEELKYAACAVAEAYNSVFVCESNAKKNETTDGYSVSYVVQGQDGESNESLFRRKAYESARRWLVGTGLLQRSVRRCW